MEIMRENIELLLARAQTWGINKSWDDGPIRMTENKNNSELQWITELNNSAIREGLL